MNNPSGQSEAGLGRGMLYLAAIGLLGGLTLVFSSFSTGPGGGMSRGTDASGQSTVVLEQGRGNHYLAEGSINGQSITFLVDTGATDVALSERQARSMGLRFGPQMTVQTAAGPARAWVTRLDQVTVGDLQMNDVRAMITPGLGEEALLGMSFLKHFDIRQESGTLIIGRNGSAQL
jgi:aspartyl protease family protein